MKISRELNGIKLEFELTDSEMRAAYWEQKDNYLEEDIRSRYNVPDKEIGWVVNDLNNAFEHNDNYWDAYWEQIENICSEQGFEEVGE